MSRSHAQRLTGLMAGLLLLGGAVLAQEPPPEGDPGPAPPEGQVVPDPLQPPPGGEVAPDPQPPPPDGPQPPAMPQLPGAGEEYDPEAPGEPVRVERPEEQERVEEQLKRIREVRPRALTAERESVNRLENLPAEAFSPVLAARRETIRLTLPEAIGLALQNNPDYLVALLQARSAAEGVPEAVAAFLPALTFEAAYTEGRPPFFSANPFSGFPIGLQTASFDNFSVTGGITNRFLTGTTVNFRWQESRQKTENQFSLNPSYSPSLTVELVQPLLRGFGIEVNATPIYLAENASLQQDAVLAQTLSNGVLAVEQAYWNLVRAESELRSQESSLSSALKFLDDQRRRREVGAAADLDVIIAQAGVAQRREGLIVAENAVEARRDELLRLVRPSGEPHKWNVFIVPLDLPWILPEPPMDVESSLAKARERRPDFYQAHLQVEAARRTLLLRENESLPQLDGFATFNQEGLGGQHHNSWSALGSGRFYTWTVGVRVNLPLFLHAERARARRAELDLQAAEAALRGAEANLVLDVRRSIRDVHTAKARIEAARANRILAARRLRATRTQVEHGTAVPRDVLDDLAALAIAESNEIQAYVNYRLALSAVQQAEGSLLDPWLDRLDPRVRRALERLPYDGGY